MAYNLISDTQIIQPSGDYNRISNIYSILKDLKGKEEACTYITNSVHGLDRLYVACLLYHKGQFDPILQLFKTPEFYEDLNHNEFAWIQKLIAWIALNRHPENLEEEFLNHYATPSKYYYRQVGQFLLGKLTKGDFIKTANTPKKRCEFAYYIGLNERLNGNFKEASNWYQICLETNLPRNGEYGWALKELKWWGQMGTEGRHRLIIDDMNTFYNNL